MKVGVIGGGVIGLACAHRLARADAEVVVVERDVCGHATSLGNAGWVTPILSTPVPAPGALATSLRWLFDPKSPLLIRPRLDLSFANWCLRFSRNCTHRRFEDGVRALLALNERTFELFDQLQMQGIDFEMHRAGMVIAVMSEHELEKEWNQLDLLRRLGYSGPVELVGGKEIRRLEPILSRRVVGGIYAQDERHVRPEELTAGLAQSLRSMGVQILEHAPVQRVDRAGAGWLIKAGSTATVRVDRVLIAAGVWSSRLLRTLGTRIPLESGKGYSVTITGRGQFAEHPIMLQESKIGCSPFSNGFRLAGTMEFAGESLTLNRRRVGAIVERASRYLDCDLATQDLGWAGLRPMLPDGLPVIGRVPSVEGVFVATGHAMLGITLAPATAEALAPLVLEDRMCAELDPFKVDRRY